MIGILLSRALCTDIKYDETKQLLTINADIAYTRKEIDVYVGGKNVQHIEISGTYQEIPEGAFAMMNVEDIKITSTITKINDAAFYNCILLKTFTLPDGCTYIGFDCFRGCVSLASFYYRNSLMTVQGNAFQECVSLKEYKLADGDQSKPVEGQKRTFGPNVFNDCKSLVTCELPDDTAELGQGMFTDSQVNMKIPTSVTKIPNYCFKNTKMVEANLENVAQVGIGAFQSCSLLAKVTFGTSLSYIQSYAFQNCPKAVISIPDGQDYIFEMYCFSGIEAMTEFTVPFSMYSIPPGAFMNCVNLETVHYHDHMFQIWDLAFMNTKLSSLFVPWRTLWVAPGAFASIKSASTFNVEGGNAKVMTANNGKYLVRYDNATLIACVANDDSEEITIPDNYVMIMPYAFYGNNAKKINFGDQSGTIGEHAFAKMPRLTEITIPTGVATIFEGVFQDCPSVTKITLNDVREIKDKAFHGLKSLTEVYLSNVQRIGEHTFCSCSNLNKITNMDKLQYAGKYAFNNCGFTSFEFPASLLQISSFMLSNNKKLAKVKTLGANTIIRNDAFSGCESLKTAIFTQNVPQITEFAFKDTVNFSNIVYCGDDEPADVTLQHHNYIFVYTTKEYKENTFLGHPIQQKLDQCTDTPPNPPAPTALPPTPVTPEPTKAPTVAPYTPTPKPDTPSSSKVMKITVIALGSSLGVLLVVFVIFCIRVRRSPKAIDTLNSTPLVSNSQL